MSGSLSRIRLYAGTLTCARTDGVGVSSGGRDVHTRCPLARPFGGSPPLPAGALPPEFIHGSRRTLSFLAVSQLSTCMCLISRVLYCCSRSHRFRVVCILLCGREAAFCCSRAFTALDCTAIASAMLLATAATSFSSLPLTAADRTLTELTERRFAAFHLL